MIDPLAEVVTLLQPSTRYSKLVHGASPWRISRTVAGEPFYCVVLEGGCRVAIDGHPPIELLPGDFVLIPAAYGVAISSLELPPPGVERPRRSCSTTANTGSATRAAQSTRA